MKSQDSQERFSRVRQVDPAAAPPPDLDVVKRRDETPGKLQAPTGEGL